MSDQHPTQPQYQPYQYGPGYVPQMPVTPVKSSKLKRFGLPIGLLLLGLIIGGSAGASAVPEPVVQVQEKVVEKKVKVEVPITPSTCKAALDYAGQINDLSAEAMGYMSEAMEAAARLDAAAISGTGPKLDAVTAKLKGIGPDYQSNRDDCLAG